ncbi:MAG: Proposed peptidoglycan lipid II flippase MurJ [uncultured Sulfurovum sp.]|uniref:Probable lipid II flippase MurJ n=1 Tax=uncultured Sulfurovum sp. TaxID=269237 RepID=A0A6S6SZM3_9BACT|nr:MAG: Proposed peptidoglycan lipid II flippase MurJ [uncultured Sulfurovum sp.]
MKLKSFFSNSFGILFSRVTGLGRDVAMASALGASIWTDIFFVAFKLPNLFRRIFAEGAFTQAFMPSFIASKQKGVFATAIFLRFMLILIAFSLLVTLFPEILTKIITPDWSSEQIAQTAPLTAINFWYLDLVFIVTFLATLLQYKEHFATSAMSTALLNISMIAALLFYMKEEPETIIVAVSFAVLIGGLLQVIAHLIAIKHFNLQRLLIGGWKYRKKESKQEDLKKEKKEFNNLFFPSVWGNSMPQISSFIDTILASFLISGSISYLFYANRVFQLPLAIIAIAASIALFPAISKAIKHDNEALAYQHLNRVFWILLALLGVATLTGIILAEPIIWLLFERGAYTAEMTVSTANVLAMYMLGLIPYGLAKLFALFLYAKKEHVKAAKIATITLVINIAISFTLMKLMGVAGLALAGSIGGLIFFILTLRGVGFHVFTDIMNFKKLIYLGMGLMLSAFVLLFFNELIMGWIR